MASALLMALICMGVYRTAEAVDITQPVSLGVVPAGPEYMEDLSPSDVFYDLYLVADAKDVPGYDTYDFPCGSPTAPRQILSSSGRRLPLPAGGRRPRRRL